MIIKHLLLVAALEPLNMQIWFNDPFLILQHYSFWDIVNLAKVVIIHWNMWKMWVPSLGRCRQTGYRPDMKHMSLITFLQFWLLIENQM
jgi:hypothetical protein